MTYIEFFDKQFSENVCASLSYIPDRVIYIGDNAKIMNRFIECCQCVFRGRGIEIEFLSKVIQKSNLDEAVSFLTGIVNEYEDCVFDITGGDEMLVLALGIVCANNPDKNIQVHKFNLRNNVIFDYDKDGNTIYKETPALSVKENIRIYGGTIVYGDVLSNDKTYMWDLSSDFVKDINSIWDICKKKTKSWNIFISILDAVECVGSISEQQTLLTVAPKRTLEQYLCEHNIKYVISRDIVNYLTKHKLLTFSDDSDNGLISVSYKNEQIKKCLTKAGQALEMKIYITAKGVCDSCGKPIYNDAVNGAVIDWDGELHDEEPDTNYDTENEIDILLMHDMVPVFISCKNGLVTADELYKLNTVAERFGGQYAKKVLVATSLNRLGKAGEYLRQRAKDMKIKIIENVNVLSDADLEDALKNLWRS